MTLASEITDFLIVQLVDCQDIHGHNDDHGEVEGEERPNDDKIFIVYLTNTFSRHHIVHVLQGKQRNG